jgi:ribosomal protein S18 acetylase RimI-like enzyme
MADTAGATIVEASVADAGEVSALATRTYIDAFGADFEPGDLAYHVERTLTLPRWLDYMARDRVLLARIGGQAVGYIQFGPAAAGEGIEVVRLYVEAARQGHGIGGSLLRAALAGPEASAAPAVFIAVWEDNARARRLYERFGFRHEGEKKPFLLKSGEVSGYDLVLVRRRATAWHV